MNLLTGLFSLIWVLLMKFLVIRYNEWLGEFAIFERFVIIERVWLDFASENTYIFE